MAISFYEASVGAYLQSLDAVSGVLEKGAQYAAENGLDLQEIVATRLHEDMRPFHFQIVSVAHHSRGAVQAMQSGTFRPPTHALDKDYAGLQALVVEARHGLAALDEQEVEALGQKSLVFDIGAQQLPFTNQNFLLSFSLPSFYFHVTTTYDILRMLGVPLAKGDFLGATRIGT